MLVMKVMWFFFFLFHPGQAIKFLVKPDSHMKIFTPNTLGTQRCSTANIPIWYIFKTTATTKIPLWIFHWGTFLTQCFVELSPRHLEPSTMVSGVPDPPLSILMMCYKTHSNTTDNNSLQQPLKPQDTARKDFKCISQMHF